MSAASAPQLSEQTRQFCSHHENGEIYTSGDALNAFRCPEIMRGIARESRAKGTHRTVIFYRTEYDAFRQTGGRDRRICCNVVRFASAIHNAFIVCHWDEKRQHHIRVTNQTFGVNAICTPIRHPRPRSRNCRSRRRTYAFRIRRARGASRSARSRRRPRALRSAS
jgi:hypothetical protein